jgi:hypothetical protein
MEEISVSRCTVCGGSNWQRLMDTVETEKGEQFSIFECASCGVARTWPIPPDLSRYYSSELGALYLAKGAPLYEFLKRQLMLKEFSRIRHLAQSGVPFLDVGTGTGDFACVMADTGARVLTVDATSEIPVRLRGRTDVPHHVMSYDTYSVEGLVGADGCCVVARHVVEHLKDPSAFIRQMVAQGAKHFYIVVPNAASLSRRLYGKYWFAWDPPRHLWHFTKATMEQLLNSQGVRTMASGYVASTMMTASVYRMLRMNNAPEWLCQAANPKGAVSGLVGGTLDAMCGDAAVWVYGQIEDRSV